MQCGIGHCGHCQLGPTLVCRDGPVYRWTRARAVAGDPGAVMRDARRAGGAKADARGVEVRLLRRLPAEPARLRGRAAGARRAASRSRTSSRPRSATVRRARTTSRSSRARSRPRTTRSGSARCARSSRALITIGACATAGGIQALRNFADVDEFTRDRVRLARLHLARSPPRRRSAPTCASTSSCSGCPINKQQLLEVISAHLRRAPSATCARTACAWSASGAGPCA